MSKVCPRCRVPLKKAGILPYIQSPLLAKQVWAEILVRCGICERVSDPESAFAPESRTCAVRQTGCCARSFVGTLDQAIERAYTTTAKASWYIVLNVRFHRRCTGVLKRLRDFTQVYK